jgi:hypothetical protein
MMTSELIMPKTLKTQKEKNEYRNPIKGIERFRYSFRS